jgi:hypothetical protein
MIGIELKIHCYVTKITTEYEKIKSGLRQTDLFIYFYI